MYSKMQMKLIKMSMAHYPESSISRNAQNQCALSEMATPYRNNTSTFKKIKKIFELVSDPI